MAVEEAKRSHPPLVDPHLLFFRRAVGGKRVGLVGDAVLGAVAGGVGLRTLANLSIDCGKFFQSRIDFAAPQTHAREPTAATLGHMERPGRFEHTRFLGDKRTQLVYDLDSWTDESIIDDIVANEVGLCFGPDTLAEARNRGYTLATPGASRRHRKPRA